MARENHPSTSHYTKIGKAIRVWGTIDSNSGVGLTGQVSHFWGYVIMHFEKLEMDLISLYHTNVQPAN